MKKDIENIKDVQLLVDTFYGRVLKDDMLYPFFEYVHKHHWAAHLNVLYSFWENVLFYTGNYDRNPLKKHQTLHHFKPLNDENFERWLQLFTQTADELFEGEKAELAKQRALSIATIMRIKIVHNNKIDKLQ